ncbi:hypothetical protein [Rectinema subterraneum]|nr:hypothetical protein [Rectinema subterraneum]
MDKDKKSILLLKDKAREFKAMALAMESTGYSQYFAWQLLLSVL